MTKRILIISIALLTLASIAHATNYALNFDGTDDYVNCGSINLSGSTLTLECWVKLNNFDNPGQGVISLIGTEQDGNFAYLRLGDGGVPLPLNQAQFVINIGGSPQILNGTSVLEANKWYHIAGVYDTSSGMKLYINGVLDTSNSLSGTVTSNSSFFIGNNKIGDNRFIDGMMDEVRVWNTARSESDIVNNMNSELVGNEAGLAAYYKMNEGNGTTLTDSTANSNTGTILGASWVEPFSGIYNVTISTAYSNGFWSSGDPNIWTPSASGSTVSVTEIQTKLNAGTSVVITTGSGAGEAGDITISSAISKTAGGAATLTLKAYRGIRFTAPAAITSSSSPLNVVLWARCEGNDAADDSKEGSVWLPRDTSITTNGGNVTIGGGSDPAVGYAMGINLDALGENNAIKRGAAINGNISASGGNITIRGRATPSVAARGVSVGGNISTTGLGTIYIDGIANGASDGLAVGDSSLSPTAGSVVSANGSITLIGKKATGSNAININSGSDVTSTGSGNIILTSTLGNIVATSTGTGWVISGGTTTITAPAGAAITLNNTNNDFTGAVSVSSGGAVGLVDKNSLTLGAVNVSGAVDIASGVVESGDLTLTGAVATTDTTSSAVILNAGKAGVAGSDAGGNLIVSGGTVSFGSGGIAKLYTGSISGSTGVTGLTGYNASQVYYSSDEGSSLSPVPETNKLYVVYREALPTYTVTYNGNGADSATPPTDATAYPQGSTVTVLGNTGTLAKTGYTFDGWNTAADGSGTTYQAGNTFSMETSNITLYALWSAQINKLQDFSSSTALTENFTEGTNSSGTSFVWNSDSGLGGGAGITVSMPSDQIWTTKESYTVTSGGVYIMSAYFKMADNSGYGALGFSTESINSASGSNGMPGSGSFIGISFHGGGGNWLNNSLGSSLSWAGGDMAFSPATWYFFELVVEAKGSNNFDLTFRIKNSDNNGNIGTLHTEHTTTLNNSNISGASNLYVFFSADGSRTGAIDDFRIQLSGGANISYSVTYNGNAADSGTPPTDGNAYLQSATVTVLGNTGTLAKTGYTFDGWNTAADGSGTTYQAGNTFSMGTSNITLYAVWDPSGPTATAPSSGDGSSGNPYQIATLENLYWIAVDSSRWNKHYIQTADIDASATSAWDSGAGWTPIGNNTTKFTGSYDGNNMRISNLYINRPGISYVGLFGYIEAASQYFKRITIDGGNITGGGPTGAIAGAFFYGIMEDCSSSAAVTGTSNVGGIAGQLVSNSATNGIIRRCSSSGSVTGSGQAGGLVGLNQANGDAGIHQSFATGNVNIGAGNKAGGLVGYNGYASIRNSYSTGTVTGGSEIGGFIGYLVGIASSYIGYNYSTGQVIASGALKGGFLGSDGGGATNADNFWDTETSGQAASQGSGAAGKTSSEMKLMSTFTNWDFPTTWHIDESASSPDNNGYPSLAWQGLTHYVSVTNYTITASKTGTGSGTITSSPAGINCGVDCSESVLQDTNITLTASADSGSTFTGWSGGGCAGNGSCTVTVNSDLTVTGNFGTSTTERGYALNFDGSDDYVDLGDDADLEFTGSMTIEAWIKPSPQSTISTIASKKYPGGSNTGHSFFVNNWSTSDRRLIFESQDKILQTGENAVNFNEWQHVAVTVSGGTVGKLYINGVEQSVTGEVGLTADTTNPFQIGAMSGLYPFIGEIDEFRVWNVARTQAEIQTNKDVELTGSEPGLLVYYNFNQGIPSSDNSGLTIVYDKTSNNKNGTLNNFALNGASSNWVMVSSVTPNNYALSFGGNAYVEINDNLSLDLTTTYTIEAWIKPASFAWLGGIVGKYHTTGSNGYTLRLSLDPPYSGINFDEMSTDEGILTLNQWQHIAAVNDNGTRKVYVNGVEQTSLSGIPSYTVEVNTDPLVIGADFLESPRYFNGLIDEVRVWSVARSQTDIVDNMYIELAGNESGLAAYYNMNEGIGISLDDTSPNSNTGTINGAAWVVSDCFVPPSTYTVTGTARYWSGDGSVTPASQTVIAGNTASLTITPEAGSSISTVTGCGGTLSGTGPTYTYTTGAINADCEVIATFSLNNYTVGASVSGGIGGSINPSSRNVKYNSPTTFTITPDWGYHIDSVSGCSGTLSGNIYNTGAVTDNCGVTASFSLNSYTVNASATANGTIMPSGDTIVTHGNTTSFTITPDAGYDINYVLGCGGSVSGTSPNYTYTTGAITGNCKVMVFFKSL